MRARLETFLNRSRSCTSGQYQPLHGLALVVSQSFEARPWGSFFQRASLRVPDRLSDLSPASPVRSDFSPEALPCLFGEAGFPQSLRLLSQLALDSIPRRLGIVAGRFGLPEAGFRPGAGGFAVVGHGFVCATITGPA